MNFESFYESRKAEWQQFSQLLDQTQKGFHSLSPEQVKMLGRLYRAVASDLAIAQREFPTNHKVNIYLNQLVARGHAIVYRSEPLAFNRIKHFVTHGFPQTYRQTLPFTLLAALLLILPALLAGLATYNDPATARWMLPVEVQNLIPMIEKQELWVNIPTAERPYTSAFIMTNNIRVTFIAFGGGVTAGLLTIYAMIFNGLLLGGITGITAYHGVGFDLWTFVIGHGVIELSTIFIAGGSGLMLGWAIINPGLQRRRDALAAAARQAVRLIIGCVPLLVLAGIIESFISPHEAIPWPAKWATGIVTGIILYAYLLLAGRSPKQL